MEEADNIVILSLNDIGCEIDSEIKSLKQFDVDLVYKACVAYIRLIDEQKAEQFTDTLPRGMSARVNVCSAVANTIKELGYRGELNFHQLLYPNDNDTRKILMWLAQAVPKKEFDKDDGKAGPVLLSDTIARSLATASKDVWAPIRRRPTVILSTVPLKTPARGRALKTVPGLEKYFTKYLPPVTAQVVRRVDIAPSVFEANLVLFAEAQEIENEWNTKGITTGLNPIEYKKRKLASTNTQMANYLRVAASESSTRTAEASRQSALDKLIETLIQSGGIGTRLGRQKDFTTEEEAAPMKESEEERARKQEQEVEALQQELSRVEQILSAATQETQNLVALIRQLEARLQEEEAKRAVLEKEYRTKKPTLEMLSDADNNIAQLQALSNAAAQRLLQLATEWEQHRVPLMKQYRDLKDAQLNKQDETKVKLEQIKAMRATMKSTVEEIHQKEDHYKQLVEAYESLPKDVTRAVYTRRILEIVKNVKKQKVDIDKILIETRNLRKEINSVTDTLVLLQPRSFGQTIKPVDHNPSNTRIADTLLGRVFTIVDELIFQDANTKKDQTAVQAYKYLASMDENFKKLGKIIEDTGATRNSILNLEVKIEQIQLRTNSLNVDRLAEDLSQVKEENKKLAAKLGSPR